MKRRFTVNTKLRIQLLECKSFFYLLRYIKIKYYCEPAKLMTTSFSVYIEVAYRSANMFVFPKGNYNSLAFKRISFIIA